MSSFLCCLSLHSFFFHCSLSHRVLPSFPTRRSSDLVRGWFCRRCATSRDSPYSNGVVDRFRQGQGWQSVRNAWVLRSEEHTSELQSLRHLVCRLLLEKKNQTYK